MTESNSSAFILPPESRRHIGKRIAAARRFRGLTPEGIETALDAVPGLVAEIEGGDGPIDVDELHQMTTHLRIGVRFFYDGAPPSVAALIAKTIALGLKQGSHTEIAALLKSLTGGR